jgi:glycosyltransferase involved in cell wall biosynthesis
LKIVGDGPERAALEREGRATGVQAQFTGYLSGPQLAEALAGARGVVIPSEWYENAPMSVLEAMACGKPVIGARIGGIPEMIEDGVTGYLFEPGNAADLRETLERFLALPEAAVAEMGRAARRKVEKENSCEAHYEGLMQVYSRVLSGDSPKRRTVTRN